MLKWSMPSINAINIVYAWFCLLSFLNRFKCWQCASQYLLGLILTCMVIWLSCNIIVLNTIPLNHSPICSFIFVFLLSSSWFNLIQSKSKQWTRAWNRFRSHFKFIPNESHLNFARNLLFNWCFLWCLNLDKI